MRKVNPNAKKAMKLMYAEKISLADAWKRVKGEQKSTKSMRSTKRSKRRLSRAKNSIKLNRIKMFKVFKTNKSRSKRRSMKKSRHFGSEAGPGYAGQTSYPSVSAPYFNSSSPFIPASEWWAPLSNGKAQYPEMLYKN